MLFLGFSFLSGTDNKNERRAIKFNELSSGVGTCNDDFMHRNTNERG